MWVSRGIELYPQNGGQAAVVDAWAVHGIWWIELSFFFCFGMSFSDHCCVSRSSNRGTASPSLFVFSHIVFHGQVTSGRAGYVPAPFVRLADRTSAFPTARSFALSTSSLRSIFAFMALRCLTACGLFHHQFFETEES